MDALDMIFADGETPTLTQVNDTLWFIDDDSFLKEYLGLGETDREYIFNEHDLETLQEYVDEGTLSQKNFEVIKNTIEAGCHTVMQSEFDELTDEELEILDDIG